MKTIFSKEEMMQRKGCYSTQQVTDLFFSDNTEVTIETILTSKISIKDKRWFVYNSCDLTLEEKKKLSLLLSWEVLPIFEIKYPDDNRVRLCLEGVEKFNLGEIAREDLQVLRGAATDAVAVAYATDVDAAADAAYAAHAATYADAYAAYAATYAAHAAADASDAAAAAADAASGDLTYSEKLQLILIEFVK